MFIYNLLEHQKENNKIAIKHGDKKITYRQWYENSKRLSEILKSNITKNTLNIALFFPNSINYAIAYFAIQFLGKVIVPIGVQAKQPEITSTLEYCEIDIAITDTAHLEFVTNIVNEYKHRVVIYNIHTDKLFEGDADKDFISKSDMVEFKCSEDDVAIMLHTSGTTNNPKRVMLTHSNLINNIESNIQSLKLTLNDKVLIAMPMFFGYCNTAQFLTHLYLGASMVILDSVFLPKQFFQIVERERVTNFTGVPSMLLMLLDYRYANNYDYSSLRYICFGGGQMPVEKLKLLIEKYPSIGFVQTYGQTECSPRVTALLPDYALSKIGSVGTPIPNVKIQIVNENGESLTRNQIGEITVNGANTMKGYYKQPKITQQTIQHEWVYTGDLGYIDDDGFLYLTGRIKNIIISGGINIYPEEIEQILLQYNNVTDVCVVSAEHPLLGEIPIAKLVLKSPISANELKEYCSDKLADYKIPVRFEILDELPKTYNGKTKRF